MSIVNLFLDPLDASNPNFVDPEVREARAKQALRTGSNSDTHVENKPPTPPGSPCANLKHGTIVNCRPKVAATYAWNEITGFSNAILEELEDNTRDSHFSLTERRDKSRKLEARFGDLNASDKNPLKTVVYTKSHEVREIEKEMRDVAAAARPKKNHLKLSPTRARKRIRDRSKRKYTWKFPDLKNKAKLRARKQKMGGAKALMDRKVASKDEDQTLSLGSPPANMDISDEEDGTNALFDGTSDIEGYGSDGYKTNQEGETREDENSDDEMIDSEYASEVSVSESHRNLNSVHGSMEDAKPTDTRMHKRDHRSASGTISTTSCQITNRINYWLYDMTVAAAKNKDAVLMGALASLNDGVPLDKLDPVQEFRVREMIEWYDSVQEY